MLSMIMLLVFPVRGFDEGRRLVVKLVTCARQPTMVTSAIWDRSPTSTYGWTSEAAIEEIETNHTSNSTKYWYKTNPPA
jgi:hypothetical protein